METKKIEAFDDSIVVKNVRIKEDQIYLRFLAIGKNEAFARAVVAAFLIPEDPTLTVLDEVKTAVSEAVTNVVVHAYPKEPGNAELRLRLEGGWLYLSIRDEGIGIEDVSKAMEAEFSTKHSERSGLGFTFMEAFMDELKVISKPGKGTTVFMKKQINPQKAQDGVAEPGQGVK